MARPKKNDNMPEARERLISAFWTLLETHDIRSISVGMIVDQAACNRGTFYYHFQDKEALMNTAVEQELHELPHAVFSLMSHSQMIGEAASNGSDEYDANIILSEINVVRLALFMKHGGRDIAEERVLQYALNMWTAVFSADFVFRDTDSVLTDETKLILSGMVSGSLGIVQMVGLLNDEGKEVALPSKFFERHSSFILSSLCEAQGVSKNDVISKLFILNQFDKLNTTAR